MEKKDYGNLDNFKNEILEDDKKTIKDETEKEIYYDAKKIELENKKIDDYIPSFYEFTEEETKEFVLYENSKKESKTKVKKESKTKRRTSKQKDIDYYLKNNDDLMILDKEITNIKWSPHARERLIERTDASSINNLKKEAENAILSNGDSLTFNNEHELYFRNSEAKRYRVVVTKLPTHYRIKTIYQRNKESKAKYRKK